MDAPELQGLHGTRCEPYSLLRMTCTHATQSRSILLKRTTAVGTKTCRLVGLPLYEVPDRSQRDVADDIRLLEVVDRRNA